jgi:predicted GH43/DUF377 family glycosyl hydrolase
MEMMINHLMPSTIASSSMVFPTSPVRVRRLPIRLESDERQIIARPFILGSARVRSLFNRLQKLSESQVELLLQQVERSYAHRHQHLRGILHEHYISGAEMIGFANGWSRSRQLLAGAYLTMEYSVASAALFNPSVVSHPDQSGVMPGECRIIMSLRATGEGHVSSIVFRTGRITADGSIGLDPLPATLHRSRISPDRFYVRSLFLRKLQEMRISGPPVDTVFGRLPERFTLAQLMQAVEQSRASLAGRTDSSDILATVLWLANSNYHIDLAPDAELSELVIFPMSDEAKNGIEDLRLVRFVDDDGQVTWYGTYTAFNGVRTLPMLMETRDFRRIEFCSLNGAGAMNKGMALFPRRIRGRYVMCTRVDGENLFLATSESVHFWDEATPLATPQDSWELMQIGNCGSPIETDSGWILLTHGVGPMRTYALGAMLLDLDNPARVIGKLREPLIVPTGEDREGYVPNVVYTCGALAHRGELFIPYAMADSKTGVAVVEIDELLRAMKS